MPEVLIWAADLFWRLASAAARLAEIVRARSAGSYEECEVNLMDDDCIDDERGSLAWLC